MAHRAARFHSSCEKCGLAERQIEPFPDQEASEHKAPLRRAVQLLKRHRDVAFDASDLAPRSIALTTLAGHHYRGEPLVTDALLGILDGIVASIEAQPGVMQIPNPSNPSEMFCEAWSSTPDAYRAFVEYIKDFRERFSSLLGTTGLDAIAHGLNNLFGEKVTKRAFDAFADRLNQAREREQIHFGRALVGLTAPMPRSKPIPRNTFYGR
jgi:hypothetical protein